MKSIQKIQPCIPSIPQRKRVAAYARVSSGKDAMLHSLSAQISYYSNLIQVNAEWEYAGVYADEALTGTKDNRAEFQKLLSNCKNGQIDMVITKSISRFARNTVTLLETVRDLKQHGVDVYFEKENIHSISGDGELMLSILASFAQEESKSVSDNMKWSIRNGFKQGKPTHFDILGYDMHGGELTIIPSEANVVRQIYSLYLSGIGRSRIVKLLNSANLRTKDGKPWSDNAVYRVLTNEKYTGNMLLQKWQTADHLTKKTVSNDGELPKYYVENSHEAIIALDTFNHVQELVCKRAMKFHPQKTAKVPYPFTGLISCGICGRHYQRKTGNAGTKYAKPVWICESLNIKGKDSCKSKRIPEAALQTACCEALDAKDFDERTFSKRVQSITAYENNTLVFHFYDGSQQTVIWQNKPRSSGWTDEMRKAASSKTQERWKHK